MNTLHTAKDYMAAFENDGNRSFRNVEIAKAYAAIAQAEQLKRIADAQERDLVLTEEYHKRVERRDQLEEREAEIENLNETFREVVKLLMDAIVAKREQAL
jgi:hypothetical protein